MVILKPRLKNGYYEETRAVRYSKTKLPPITVWDQINAMNGLIERMVRIDSLYEQMKEKGYEGRPMSDSREGCDLGAYMEWFGPYKNMLESLETKNSRERLLVDLTLERIGYAKRAIVSHMHKALVKEWIEELGLQTC